MLPVVSIGVLACAPGVALADTARRRASLAGVKAGAIAGFVLNLVVLVPAAFVALWLDGVWLLGVYYTLD